VSTGTSTSESFVEANAKVLSSKTGYVTTGAPLRMSYAGESGAGTDAGEALLSDSFEVTEFTAQNNVKTSISTGATGTKLVVTGYDKALKLKHKVILETGDAPGAIAVSSYYTYDGEGTLAVTKFVDNNFKIEATPLGREVLNGEVIKSGGLWSWQGNEVAQQIEKVTPVFDTMGTRNSPSIVAMSGWANGSMARNNWQWTHHAGVAYNFFWGSDVGIGVGSLMPYHINGLEIPVRGSGLAGNHNVGYTWVGWPGKTLESGKEAYIGTSVVTVVDGDMGNGVDKYARAMDNLDIKPFVDRGEFVTRDQTTNNFSFTLGDYTYDGPTYNYVYGADDYKGVPTKLLQIPKGDELPSWAYDPIWESWGYGETMAPRALFYVIPILPKLGYQSVTYDAFWYEGRNAGSSVDGADPIMLPQFDGSRGRPATSRVMDWGAIADLLSDYFTNNPHSLWDGVDGSVYDFRNLSDETQTGAIECVRAFNEYIHEHGMKALAWNQNSVIYSPPKSRGGPVPDSWSVRGYDGGPLTSGAWNGQALNRNGCTGNPEYINDATTYISELMYGDKVNQYNFDGYKGDTFYGVSPCFATDHGHGTDYDSTLRNYGLFWKNLYDKANYIRGATESVGGPIVDVEKMAVIKNCFCGGVMDYYSYAGTNRPIWGDHNGTKQNRQGNRIWRGFYGWDVPMDADHHDTDFRGNQAQVGDFDYANALGTGMVYNSKTRINLNHGISTNSESSSLMTFPGNPVYNDKFIRNASGAIQSGMMGGSIKWGRAVKYYGLYHDIKTPQSRMIEDLYKYVVDYPEAYAIELLDKDPATGALSSKAVEERIYSFFATTFPVDKADAGIRTTANTQTYLDVLNTNSSNRTYDPYNSVYKDYPNGTTLSTTSPRTFTYTGNIEIRGLKSNTEYLLTDIETGAKLLKTSDANGNIIFDTTFVNSVLYHVTEAITGSISGMVYGSDGAILPGATISLYNDKGEKAFSDTASDLDGFYSFPLVPAGKYTIKATFPNNYTVPAANEQGPINLDYFEDISVIASVPFIMDAVAIKLDLGPTASNPQEVDFISYDDKVAFSMTVNAGDKIDWDAVKAKYPIPAGKGWDNIAFWFNVATEEVFGLDDPVSKDFTGARLQLKAKFGDPTVYVTGPAILYSFSDKSATYKFFMKYMPESIGAITLTFRVEDAFFYGQSMNALGEWQILKQSDWIPDGDNDEYWKKTVTLALPYGAAAGNIDFFEAVLELRDAVGFTEVKIIGISAAYPGGEIPVIISDAAVTEVLAFSIYYVNRDGKVDLDDVAAAAYYFMWNSKDKDWEKPFKFDDVEVIPKNCDVDLDGKVDISDLILILANYRD
jgi:hypothetical protein